MSGWHNNKNSANVARSDRPREHVLADMVRDFLKKYPVGTPVWYWKSLPDGPKVAATVRTAPFVEGDEVRCFLHNVRGVVSIDFISPREEAKTQSRKEDAGRAEEPVAAAAAGVSYVVATFTRGGAVPRTTFEAAAGRPIVLAGGGPESSLFGVAVHPGENAQELKRLLRKKFPAGRFSIQDGQGLSLETKQ